MSTIESTASEAPVVYTIAEAAKLLKVSTRTIYNAMNAGKIFSVPVLGSRRIPADEIRRIVTLGTIATPEQIDEHFRRVDPENLKFVREELTRRLAAREQSQ